MLNAYTHLRRPPAARRPADILGRRRTFIAGILVFTLASFLGGLATTSGLLLAARALQGVGAAIAAPTALSLITTNFAEGTERNRAFGVFSAVAVARGAIGLIAGGILTSWLSWRWVLFVNVPIGVVLASLALYIGITERQPGTFDLGGALTSTAGMTALVYGFIRAAQEGWSDPGTIVSFTARRCCWPCSSRSRPGSGSPSPAAPVPQPQPGRQLLTCWPCPRPCSPVLLPDPVRPGRPRLQPAAGRHRLPPYHRRRSC